MLLGTYSALGGSRCSFGGSGDLQYIPAIFTTIFVGKEGVEPTCNQTNLSTVYQTEGILAEFFVDIEGFEPPTSTLSVLRY